MNNNIRPEGLSVGRRPTLVQRLGELVGLGRPHDESNEDASNREAYDILSQIAEELDEQMRDKHDPVSHQ